MRAEPDLKEAYQPAPKRAHNKGRDYAKRNMYIRGSLHEHAYKHGRNAAHYILALSAYVEYARFEGECYGKTRKYIRYGVFYKAVGHILCGAEYYAEQLAIGLDRVVARDDKRHGAHDKADYYRNKRIGKCAFEQPFAKAELVFTVHAQYLLLPS